MSCTCVESVRWRPWAVPPALFFAECQHRFQEAFFSREGHQTRPKFAQDGVIKSRIRQFQTQSILPVEPTAHRKSLLPIGQVLHELEDGDQRQTPRRIGGLPALGIPIAEQFILVDCSQRVAQLNVHIPLGEDGMHDSGGFGWDLRDRLRFHRHGWPPAH